MSFAKTHTGGFGSNVFTESAGRSLSVGMKNSTHAKKAKVMKKKE